MRPYWGDDYGIACCVSAMRIGKQMQFFGARVNLAKALLYAINGGRDEISGDQVGAAVAAGDGDVLDYDDVLAKFDAMMEWLARTYVHAHELHPLHARQVLLRAPGDGAARPRHPAHHGLRHRRPVGRGRQPVGDQAREGACRSATTTGSSSTTRSRATSRQYGNNDDRVDDIAADLVSTLHDQDPQASDLPQRRPHAVGADHHVATSSTARTPATRRTAGARASPSRPGANPMHGRDSHGWLASCISVAKLPYADAQDGISYTVIGRAEPRPARREAEASSNAVKVFDTYFGQGGFHMNLNVLSTARRCEDAMEHPEKYPQLTIRVSGYAVNFVRLTREQQLDVISRTFHGKY